MKRWTQTLVGILIGFAALAAAAQGYPAKAVHVVVPYPAGGYYDLLARFPDLGTRLRQVAGTLSGGQQQMLVITRAHFVAAAENPTSQLNNLRRLLSKRVEIPLTALGA